MTPRFLMEITPYSTSLLKIGLEFSLTMLFHCSIIQSCWAYYSQPTFVPQRFYDAKHLKHFVLQHLVFKHKNYNIVYIVYIQEIKLKSPTVYVACTLLRIQVTFYYHKDPSIIKQCTIPPK